MEDQELVLRLASMLYEKKAQDIVVLKVSHMTVLCDYLVIATGRTASQVSGLTDYVNEWMAGNGRVLRRSEGAGQRGWAGLDYNNILVHLFHREEREYYGLDRLWNDGSNLLDLPFDQSVRD